MKWWFNKSKQQPGQPSEQKPSLEVLEPEYEETLRLPGPNGLYDPRGRHLLVFLDGTWNEERTPIGEATPTNVLRMFQEIEKSSLQNGEPAVLARYYRGVGSMQDNGAMNRKWFGFNGKDEERIRAAAFAGLYRDYKSINDVIYILGFSRGAASARLLARDLCDNGFPPQLKVRTKHFANRLTRQIEARIESIQPESSSENNVRPRIKFLGCWDTVDAFTLPSRFPKNEMMDKAVRLVKKSFLPSRFGLERFADNERGIPGDVEHAVHCVAIDETRDAFLPTLMPAASNVEEVWFPGAHSDVGGGYDKNLLANEAYEFMKQRLLSVSYTPQVGAPICFNPPSPNLEADSYCFHFHGLNSGFRSAGDKVGFGTSLRKIRVLGGSPHDKPKLHESVTKVMLNSNLYAVSKKNESKWRIKYDPYNVGELKGNFSTVATFPFNISAPPFDRYGRRT